MDQVQEEVEKKEPCEHEWVKVASSMAESQYECTICGEQDWH